MRITVLCHKESYPDFIYYYLYYWLPSRELKFWISQNISSLFTYNFSIKGDKFVNKSPQFKTSTKSMFSAVYNLFISYPFWNWNKNALISHSSYLFEIETDAHHYVKLLNISCILQTLGVSQQPEENFHKQWLRKYVLASFFLGLGGLILQFLAALFYNGIILTFISSSILSFLFSFFALDTNLFWVEFFFIQLHQVVYSFKHLLKYCSFFNKFIKVLCNLESNGTLMGVRIFRRWYSVF